MGSLVSLKDKLTQSENIAIFAHIMPDADAYGSALALKKYLLSIPENKFKNVDIFIEGDEIPELYVPMVNGSILNPVPQSKYDMVFGLDSPNTSRFGKFSSIYENAETKINIDHHLSNELYGDMNFVIKKVSSTCELLYYILKHFETAFGAPITKDIATLLFCGIITDTSCLTQGVITTKTYSVIKELIDKDVNDEALREYFFKNISKAKALLAGKATKSTKFLEDDRIAIMTIKHTDLEAPGVAYEDTLGIIDNISAIKSVDLAVVMIEKEENSFHVSMRSRGDVDCLHIAQDNGGGGNNKNIAAFQYQGDINDLKAIIVEATKREIEKHPLEEKPTVDAFNFDE